MDGLSNMVNVLHSNDTLLASFLKGGIIYSKQSWISHSLFLKVQVDVRTCTPSAGSTMCSIAYMLAHTNTHKKFNMIYLG